MTQRTIWSNVTYADAAMALLREVTANHQLLLTTDTALLATADIAFGQPDPEIVKQTPSLRWVHLDSAGYEKFDTDEMRAALRERGAMMSNSSSVYDEPCAQQTLAMMLALARQLPASCDIQRGDHSWPMFELRAKTFLLNGQTVLLLGFGAIARRLVELLAPFQMNILAMRRQTTNDASVKIIGETELEAWLPMADHVVNLLPANAGTRRFMNAARFAAMKPGAIFYNIGRGVTVDQSALLEVMQTGHLAAAYLDVTDPEPLPPSHPLWTAPNCHITPHTAGGHIGERERIVRHFAANLERFLTDEPLADQII